MSATLRELVSIVQDWVGDDSDSNLVVAEINRATRFICGRNAMDALTERTTRTLDADGKFIVPPLCRQLKRVKSADEYSIRSAYCKPELDGLIQAHYRIVPAGISEAAISYALLTGDAKASILTQDAVQEAGYGIPASTTGFSLRINGVDELFEITDSVEDTSIDIRPVLGDDVSGATCSLSTNGLRVYQVYGRDLALAASETISIEYQRYHPYMYDLDDRILPDIRESVALSAVKNLLRHYKYDVDAQRLEDDLRAAMAAELAVQITSQARPAHKPNAFSVGRNKSWKR